MFYINQPVGWRNFHPPPEGGGIQLSDFYKLSALFQNVCLTLSITGVVMSSISVVNVEVVIFAICFVASFALLWIGELFLQRYFRLIHSSNFLSKE